jgi:hypothetical protein
LHELQYFILIFLNQNQDRAIYRGGYRENRDDDIIFNEGKGSDTSRGRGKSFQNNNEIYRNNYSNKNRNNDSSNVKNMHFPIEQNQHQNPQFNRPVTSTFDNVEEMWD